MFSCLFFTIIESALFSGYIYNQIPMVGSDQSHYELNARYFMETRNSWEIDDYRDERYGSSLRDDHGALGITFLVDPWLVVEIIGGSDSFRLSRVNLLWVYICLNVMLFLISSHIAQNHRAGIITVLVFGLYFYEKNFLLFQARESFRFIGLLLLIIYIENIILVIKTCELNIKHCCWIMLFCYLSVQCHTGNVYIMFGMFFSILLYMVFSKMKMKNVFLLALLSTIGTLIGISKTISIFMETGRLDSSSLFPFHGTAVLDKFMQGLAYRADFGRIISTYSIPVSLLIIMGLIGLFSMLFFSRTENNRIHIWGIILGGMLLPLLGILDWIGYDFSLWFIQELRYRIYFLAIFSIIVGWLLTSSEKIKIINCSYIILLICFCWGYVESTKYVRFSNAYVNQCVLLVEQHKNIARKLENITNGDAFLQRQVLLYYLHGTPKLLFHMYAEPLIQAKKYCEIEKAMEKLHVGAIILPPSGLEYHDYSLLPFWDYINEEFICLSSADYGKYVIFINPNYMIYQY